MLRIKLIKIQFFLFDSPLTVRVGATSSVTAWLFVAQDYKFRISTILVVVRLLITFLVLISRIRTVILVVVRIFGIGIVILLIILVVVRLVIIFLVLIFGTVVVRGTPNIRKCLPKLHSCSNLVLSKNIVKILVTK